MKVFFLAIISYVLILPVRASVYEPLVKWDKRKVRVCFVDKKSQLNLVADTILKDRIKLVRKRHKKKWQEFFRQRVNENYRPETTGIHFVGWKDCSLDPTADAFVIIDTARFSFFNNKPLYGGRATIGQNGQFVQWRGFVQKGIKRPAVRVNLLGSQRRDLTNLGPFFRELVIHEFGHLAGLRHEHTRNEILEDENCTNLEKKMGVGYLSEVAGFSAKTHGPYDPRSAMNYCWEMDPDYREEGGNLSPGDISTLAHMYQ